MQFHTYAELIENNRKWAAHKLLHNPTYFQKLATGQNPPFLLIGCSDSRKPTHVITDAEPGEIFSHHNIANQVSLTDMNMLSVLEYAVENLEVSHVIVCGHYRCGGVEAAVKGVDPGVVENWITPIKDLYLHHQDELEPIGDFQARLDRLAEINVVAQVKNLCKTSILHKAFIRGKYPSLHGWIFNIYTGLLQELPLPVTEWKEIGLLPDTY